jgi:hypothetical protein
MSYDTIGWNAGDSKQLYWFWSLVKTVVIYYDLSVFITFLQLPLIYGQANLEWDGCEHKQITLKSIPV